VSPALRKRLKNLLIFVSVLVAVAATTIWYRYRAADTPSPMWLLGVIGYAWTFVGFLIINYTARTYSRKRHPRSGQGR
jgi:hypothetical protein